MILLIKFDRTNYSPSLLDILSCKEANIDKNQIIVDVPNLEERFFALTGFKFYLNEKYGIQEHQHGELITQNKIPFSTVSHHDVIVHILPLLRIGKNVHEVFELSKTISSPLARAWAFEQALIIPQLILIHKKIEPIQVKFFMENIKTHQPDLSNEDMMEIELFLTFAVDYYSKS